MRLGELARRHWALALDGLNVRVVRWRLGQDPGAAAGIPLPGLPSVNPVPGPMGCRRPERWTSSTGDWIADRLVPVSAPSPAAMVFLHGWLATPLHLAYLRRRLRPLVRAGVEVWMPRLPAHIERTPGGGVSGVRCLSGPPESTVNAIELAANETVALGRWLVSRGQRVGLWGISLGGWVAALAATRDPLWDAAVLWSPVVDPLDALIDSPLAAPLRELRSRAGGSALDAIARHSELVPVECALAMDGDDVLVISGIYDNVARRSSIDSLCARWSVRSLQLEHGHISQMTSRRAWREGRSFVIAQLAR